MKVHKLSFIQHAVNNCFYSTLGIRRLFLSPLSKGRYFSEAGGGGGGREVAGDLNVYRQFEVDKITIDNMSGFSF